MDQRRDDWIKERAHRLWEAEGRPEGRHDRHWHAAEEEYERRRASDDLTDVDEQAEGEGAVKANDAA